MVEQGRSRQISDLEEQGWVIDDECRVRQEADEAVFGGPTYMKSPEGVMHRVAGGEVIRC